MDIQPLTPDADKSTENRSPGDRKSTVLFTLGVITTLAVIGLTVLVYVYRMDVAKKDIGIKTPQIIKEPVTQ
jgi:hypothetical protein